MMGGTRLAGLTQLVECSSCKRDAGGSSPPSGSEVLTVARERATVGANKERQLNSGC